MNQARLVRELGKNIRGTLLIVCQASSLPLARSSRKRKRDTTEVRVRPDIAITPGTPTPPTTPPTLQQVYAIDTCLATEECSTAQVNQNQSGANFHQSLRVATAVTNPSTETLNITHFTSSTTTNLSAASAQASDPSIPYSTCNASSLTLIEAAGREVSGSPGAEMDNPARGQGKEGASQDARCETPRQELRTGLSHNTGNISYYRS